ncbi:hypothetical protein B0H10DRAFT_2224460 [Mycena sp. CBHHK59/15]|nr:hypothetical protein B0H10DRAFT_2224460 [Mycena sp. CBHHK59/15]
MSYPAQYAMPSRAYSYPQAPPGFPQQPPFNGPPPQPPHIRANPKEWQNGTWTMNPAFNPSQWASAGSQPWGPGSAWLQQQQAQWQVQQQQMQQGQAFNPYKRVPRPPSAEEELYGPSNEEGIAAPTPWIWNPRSLEADDPEEGTTATNSRGPQSQSRAAGSRNAGEPPPLASAPHHGRHSFDSTANPQRYAQASEPPPPPTAPPVYVRHASQPREMTDPTPQTQRHGSAPIRHSSEPPAQRRSSTDALPQLDRPLDRPRQYQREGTPSSSTSTPPRSAPHQPETFTGARELQPTFSTNIVRTPQHYKSRSSSAGPSPTQSIYAAPSRSSIDSQLANQMQQLSTSGQQHNNPLSRQSSLPAQLNSSASSSMTGVSNFVDEPSSMLSPLPITMTAHKPSSRPLGRHSSVPVVGGPSSLSAIPEGPTAPDPRTTRSPSRNPHHARHSRHTSPAAALPPAPPSITPPRPNPLPEPPQEFGRNPGITLPVQRTPPSSYRVAMRKGLWNRRGDHLTMDGFVVYAPADRAYPQELRDYPAETVGYRDHLGSEVGYLESRPELPESLPRFGQPPRMPYDKFVVYEYMQ